MTAAPSAAPSGVRLDDMVVVTGVVNSAPLENTHDGFMLTENDFRAILGTPTATLPLCVQHDMTHVVGRVLSFWTDERGLLWVSAFIDCDTRKGAAAALNAVAGMFGGFSMQVSFDAEVFETTGVVSKLHLHEISLVSTPDDPAARLDAVSFPDDGALLNALLRWSRLLAHLQELQPPPSNALLDAMFTAKHHATAQSVDDLLATLTHNHVT